MQQNGPQARRMAGSPPKVALRAPVRPQTGLISAKTAPGHRGGLEETSLGRGTESSSFYRQTRVTVLKVGTFCVCLPGFQFRSSKHHPGEEAARAAVEGVGVVAAWADGGGCCPLRVRKARSRAAGRSQLWQLRLFLSYPPADPSLSPVHSHYLLEVSVFPGRS